MYRVAIVGTGGIATAHAEALHKASDRAKVVAAVDVDRDRAEAFAKHWSIPTAATALADVDGYDLVHICTPPGSHVELATQALAAGATVVVEKPIATSLAAVDQLLVIEAESPGSVAVVSQHRFGSGAERLRRIVVEETFGRPLIATCHTEWYRDAAYFAVPWRGSFEIEGGGPTMGHGIHQMDLLLAMLGDWQEVTALAARTSRDTGTEDVSMAMIRFASGALASVVNSVVSPREVSHLRFDFEQATVELDHLYGYTDDDFTVTAAPGFEDQVAAAWADGARRGGRVVTTHRSSPYSMPLTTKRCRQFRCVRQGIRWSWWPRSTDRPLPQGLSSVAISLRRTRSRTGWTDPARLGLRN